MNKNKTVIQYGSLCINQLSLCERLDKAIIPYVQYEIRRHLFEVFTQRFELISELYKFDIDDAYVQYDNLATEVNEVYQDTNNSELHDEYYSLLRAIDAKQAEISRLYDSPPPEYD